MEDITLPAAIAEAAIPSLPETAYYIPNFITEIESKVIRDKVRPKSLIVLYTDSSLPDRFRASSHLEASFTPPPTNLSLALDCTEHTARVSIASLDIRTYHISSLIVANR